MTMKEQNESGAEGAADNGKNDFTWDDLERALRRNVELTKKYGRQEEDKEEFERIKRKFLAELDRQAAAPCDRGVFRRYASWGKTLHMKILDFKEERRVFPNIMLASSRTYDRIDAASETAENVICVPRDGGADDPHGEFDFIDGDCMLHFCLDDTMRTGEFRLVYDSDPDFGGEESGYTLHRAA